MDKIPDSNQEQHTSSELLTRLYDISLIAVEQGQVLSTEKYDKFKEYSHQLIAKIRNEIIYENPSQMRDVRFEKVRSGELAAENFSDIFRGLEIYFYNKLGKPDSKRVEAFSSISAAWRIIHHQETYAARQTEKNKKENFRELIKETSWWEKAFKEKVDFDYLIVKVYMESCNRFLRVHGLTPGHEIFKEIDEPDELNRQIVRFKLLKVDATTHEHETHAELFSRVGNVLIDIRAELRAQEIENIDTIFTSKNDEKIAPYESLLESLITFETQLKQGVNEIQLKDSKNSLLNHTYNFVINSGLGSKFSGMEWNNPYKVYCNFCSLRDEYTAEGKVNYARFFNYVAEAWSVFI